MLHANDLGFDAYMFCSFSLFLSLRISLCGTPYLSILLGRCMRAKLYAFANVVYQMAYPLIYSWSGMFKHVSLLLGFFCPQTRYDPNHTAQIQHKHTAQCCVVHCIHAMYIIRIDRIHEYLKGNTLDVSWHSYLYIRLSFRISVNFEFIFEQIIVSDCQPEHCSAQNYGVPLLLNDRQKNSAVGCVQQ